MRSALGTLALLALGLPQSAVAQDIMFSVADATTLPTLGAVSPEDAVSFSVTAAEPGGTGGSYDVDDLILDLTDSADLAALHYVQRPVAVSASTTGNSVSPTILAGSLIMSFNDVSLNLTHGGVGINGVRDEDVVLFVPTTLGDYSSGEWFFMLDGADGGVGLSGALTSDNIDALCFVEEDITTGGIDLLAGDLLFSTEGIPLPVSADGEDIIVFRGQYGRTSAASSLEVLFNGDAEGMTTPPSEDIDSVHLVTRDTPLGDETVPAGSLIMSIAGASATSVGSPEDITPTNSEMFSFSPTSTSSGLGAFAATVGSFSPLLDGADASMGLSSTQFTAFTLLAFPELSAEITSLDVNGGDIKSGDVIQYTLTISNNTTAHASGVTVSAEIDTDTESLAVTGTGGGADNSTATTVLVDDIVVSVETAVVITWEVTVKAGVPNGEPIQLAGEVFAAAEGGLGATFNDFAGIVVVILPDVSGSSLVAVDVNSGDLMPLDVVEYTLTLTNSSSTEATGVDVTGTIPADTGSLNVTDFGSGSNVSTATAVSVENVTIAALGSEEIVWTVQIDSGIGQAVLVDMTVDVGPSNEGSAPVMLTSNPLFSIPVELSVFGAD